MLAEGSEITRLYSIQEGVGFGLEPQAVEPSTVTNPHVLSRVNVSLLFRSVNVKLPPTQLGWDTATVELEKPISLQITDTAKASWASRSTSLIVSTTDSTEKVPKSAAEVDSSGKRLTWNFGPDDLIRLPVYTRYASSVYFEFGSGGLLGGGPDAIAVVWLKDLPDDEETEIEVPILMGKDLKTLKQNALTDFTKKTHQFDIVGTLKVKLNVDAGLDMVRAPPVILMRVC